MRWLFGAHPMLYRALYLLPPLFIIGRSSDAVWSIVDLCTGIVTVPNVIAILLLSGVYFDSFAAYRALILPKSPRARRRPLHRPHRIPRRAR
jgi:Na+/alanine symporter